MNTTRFCVNLLLLPLLLRLPVLVTPAQDTTPLALTPANVSEMIEVYTLERHRAPLTSLVFTEEYALNSTGMDNWWNVWDLRNGRLSAPQRNVFGNAIYDFAIEVDDEEEVISALAVRRRGQDNVVISTTNNQLTILTAAGNVNDVQLMQDMSAVVIADTSGEVTLWRVMDGKQIAQWLFDQMPLAVYIDNATEQLFMATAGGLYSADMQPGATATEHYPTDVPITAAIFRQTPDGLRAAITTEDGTITLTDASNGRVINTWEQPATALSISASGGLLAATHEETVTVYDTTQDNPLARLTPSQTVFTQVIFSPEDVWLVAGGESGRVHVFGLPAAGAN